MPYLMPKRKWWFFSFFAYIGQHSSKHSLAATSEVLMYLELGNILGIWDARMLPNDKHQLIQGLRGVYAAVLSVGQWNEVVYWATLFALHGFMASGATAVQKNLSPDALRLIAYIVLFVNLCKRVNSVVVTALHYQWIYKLCKFNIMPDRLLSTIGLTVLICGHLI